MSYQFFSIIIPAYNEEKIISQTLERLHALEYPKDAYEIIVVENGSSDTTFDAAKQYESDICSVHAAPEKGVSRARNFGATKCSPRMEWCVFMDADVFVRPAFLGELNTYLQAHPNVGYGTVTVQLDTNAWTGKLWSRINSTLFRLFKVLYTVHIVRKDLLEKVSYDEHLTSGEDIEYGRMLARYAPYFYMPTDQVSTSDRRFKKKGYLTMFVINAYYGLRMFVLPKSKLKEIDWEPIR